MGGLPCIKEELCSDPPRQALDRISRFSYAVEQGRIEPTEPVKKALYAAIAAQELSAKLLNAAFDGCMAAAFPSADADRG